MYAVVRTGQETCAHSFWKGRSTILKVDARNIGSTQRSLWQRIYKMRAYYLLLIPFMAFVIIFKYFPMYGVTLAFKEYKIRAGILGSPWVGFKYFEQLFSSASFYEVLCNTLIISFQKLIFCFPAPIILAIFVNEIKNEHVKKVFQTVSYLPHFISWIVAGAFVYDLLALNGPINAVIQALTGKEVYFMAQPRYFRTIVILSSIWKGVGWSAIVYIAAIAGIDQELYEAAAIDGASKMRQIWHITLTGIRPTIVTLFILEIGGIMTAGFDQIFNLYSSAVYSVGDVLDTYTYRQGLQESNFSYATAAGLFQNGVGFILIIITNMIVKKLSSGEEGLW